VAAASGAAAGYAAVATVTHTAPDVIDLTEPVVERPAPMSVEPQQAELAPASLAPAALAIPVGWYLAHGSAAYRWWDGCSWTEHVTPLDTLPAVGVSAAAVPAAAVPTAAGQLGAGAAVAGAAALAAAGETSTAYVGARRAARAATAVSHRKPSNSLLRSPWFWVAGASACMLGGLVWLSQHTPPAPSAPSVQVITVPSGDAASQVFPSDVPIPTLTPLPLG
jgi:hypothetical protein